MINKQKGTYDLYGEKANEFLELRSILENFMKRYNYEYIRTPLYEATELFHRSSGETSDIVTKETYDFTDRGERKITLRPEGTAGVVRAYIENKMYTEGVKKFWYLGPMYRYERPQKGRYREHYQFGCEVFGVDDPIIDAELINIPVNLFNFLGLENIKVNVNTLGDEISRKNYKTALENYLKPHINELCDDCKVRFERNPLRILDCKVDKDSDILKNVPRTVDYLTTEAKDRFDKVLKYLEALDIDYEVNTNIVRGLDYYTHTVFEIEADIKEFGSQNVLCAGGRYNNLVEELGGKSTPAVGFGMGVERLLNALESENIKLYDDDYLDCYIIPVSENEKEYALSLAETLRFLNMRVELDYNSKTIKSNLKQAEKLNASFAIIIGENEVKEGYMTIRNMVTKEEEKVGNKNVIKYLTENITIFNEFVQGCECDCSCECDCTCQDENCTCECGCEDTCMCDENCECGCNCSDECECSCSDNCDCECDCKEEKDNSTENNDKHKCNCDEK